MTRILFILLIVTLVGPLKGQEPEYLELHKAESQMEELFQELYSDTVADVEPILSELKVLVPDILSMPGAMEYPWSRLSRIGVKTSGDQMIRVFTWHVEDGPDSYRYFGYIQVAQKRGKTGVFELKDNFKAQRGLYRADQSTENWIGKLCYGIVTKEVKRKTYYALLGMDYNTSRSNIKSVEVLSIARNKPRFEKEMFSNGNQLVDRVVLEYSNQVAISVRYDSTLDLITFDHLVPLHPIYKNNFEFYGPDGSFDGLRFEDGTWNLSEDIDARLQY
jgi:hypothetical protein